MQKSVTIISGGMDSAVMAYHLKDQGYEQEFLSFDYGQKHKKELEYAANLAGNRRHRIINLTDITQFLTSSSLTSNVDVPDGHYNENSMRTTVVPNRNAMMLSIAFSVASALEYNWVAIGVHSGDRYNYPDCRLEFTQAFQEMQNKALDGFPTPHLLTPFIAFTKADIARLGGKLKVPFEATWSCYKGGDVHCGRCGTCVERLEAMDLAGVEDKTIYADKEFWKEAVSDYEHQHGN